MAFLDKQYPDNRQQTPEQVRPFSAAASEVFRNTAYPTNHAAANNLKQVVETVSAPEYFNAQPVAGTPSSAMETLAHGLVQNQMYDSLERNDV